MDDSSSDEEESFEILTIIKVDFHETKPIKRPRIKSKQKWLEWRKRLGASNWSQSMQKKFADFFVLTPSLFLSITKNPRFKKLVKQPKNGMFSPHDQLLLILRRLKTGDNFETLAAIFGGSGTVVRRCCNNMLFALSDVLHGCMPLVTDSFIENEIKLLRQIGAPNPTNILIADGIDLALQKASSYYYSHKRSLNGEARKLL